VDTNLEYHRALIDKQLREIRKNLALFPAGRHKAHFALLSVHQLAVDMSESKTLSHESKLLLGHEIAERISHLLWPNESC
jgi:hypothetical protein